MKKNWIKSAFFMLLMVFVLLAVTVAPVQADANDGAKIRVIKPSGTLYYGDQALLECCVENVEGSYDILWEADYGQGWKTVGNGVCYSFTLTESTASAAYRAVLVVE